MSPNVRYCVCSDCVSQRFDRQGQSIWSQCVVEPEYDSSHNEFSRTHANSLLRAIKRGNELLTAARENALVDQDVNPNEARKDVNEDVVRDRHAGDAEHKSQLRVSEDSDQMDAEGDVMMRICM